MIDLFFLAISGMTSAVILALQLVFYVWWIWAPLILGFVYLDSVKKFNQKVYKAGLKWTVLELKIPTDVHKSPKAMEQVFSALHSISGFGDPAEGRKDVFKAWKESVFQGKVPDWFSFEILASGGEIHYYIRCLEKQRSIIESQIFAHFSESEITPVQDYMTQLPSHLPNEQYDVAGADLSLTKDDIFPIRTYPEFEEDKAGKDDVRRIDPLASLAEAMGAFLLGEFGAIEYLISPASEKSTKAWIKKSQSAVDKLMGKEEKKGPSASDKVFASIEGGVKSVTGLVFEQVEAKKEEKKEEKKDLAPGVGEVIRAMEKSIAKFQFRVGIKILYAAKKEKFVKERLSTLAAAFRIFSGQSLNGFKVGVTKDPKKFFAQFKAREFPHSPFSLNTEELATIYHFPDVGVKTPALPRIEAKKGEAPAGIPTV
ncbi:MAG: hypothetical protein KBC81_03595 [Candidatus Pacebacteria bacterium]|nr:hypothetical protein [Candidatus Paceibacterota bacterium]